MKFILMTACSIVAIGAVSVPAIAQDRGDGADTRHSDGTSEILVTAQRRSQNILDVPISLSVVNSEKLQTYAVTEAKDFLQLTPNVHFSEEGSADKRSIRVAMRGIANLGASGSTSDPISTFYDGVSLSAASYGSANPLLHDIERIEILRGPQGTYFGANASGGALNIVTKRPTSETEGEIEVGVRSFGSYIIGGVVNTPLSDTFATRMVAYYEKTPGVVKNVNPVGGDSSSINKDLRVSARWTPTPEFENTITVNHSIVDQGIEETVNTGVRTENAKRSASSYLPTDDGLGYFPRNIRYANVSVADEGGQRISPFVDIKTTIVTNNASYEGEGFKIESVTGYVNVDHHSLVDQDRIALEALRAVEDFRNEGWSQEIRISSVGDKKLNWVVGGIYYESKKVRDFRVFSDAEGLRPFSPGFLITGRVSTIKNENYAFFGDLTWEPVPELTMQAGVRYSHNSYFTSNSRAFNGRPPNIPIPLADQSETAKSDDWSPRISVNYKFNPSLSGYATVSKGFRPAGVRLNPGVPNVEFAKETLWNYEAGLKGDLWNNRLRFSLAGFYMDWKNTQYESYVFFTQPDGAIIASASTLNGSGKSKGLELEATADVIEGLTLSGSVGYVDSSFGDIEAQASGVLVNLKGQPLPQAPKWTLNAAATYRMPITDDWKGMLQVDWLYRGSTVANLDSYVYLSYPAGTDPFPYVTPAYDITNIRVSLESDSLSINAFVENLFNERYTTGAYVGLFLGGVPARPHPRMFGLNARLHF